MTSVVMTSITNACLLKICGVPSQAYKNLKSQIYSTLIRNNYVSLVLVLDTNDIKYDGYAYLVLNLRKIHSKSTLTTTLSIDEITVPIDSEMSATIMQMAVNIAIRGPSMGCDVSG